MDSPKDDAADDPQPDIEKADDTDQPATDANDDANDEIEDEVEEGNAFSGAVADAKEEGKDEFKFKGKKMKVKENVKNFGEFLEENFALYPSYNNMLGSEVLRDVPITHQVNMAVYGKENVIDQVLLEQTPTPAESTENDDVAK